MAQLSGSLTSSSGELQLPCCANIPSKTAMMPNRAALTDFGGKKGFILLVVQ